jgi:hypothetical protein
VSASQAPVDADNRVDLGINSLGGEETGLVLDLPPRTATDAYFASRPGQQLAVRFDVDLGELVDGHHVVARGLEFGVTGTLLHYEFVPGVPSNRPMRERVGLQQWSLHTEDSAGTTYSDPNGGAFAGRGGPAPTHGERDLGGHTAPTATWLRLEISPALGHRPANGWVRRLDIDLTTGQITTVPLR